MYMNVNLIVCTYDHFGSCMCNSLPSTPKPPLKGVSNQLCLL